MRSHALAPEHLISGVEQDDAHVGTVAFAIQHRLILDLLEFSV
jgi:hypothetical protein